MDLRPTTTERVSTLRKRAIWTNCDLSKQQFQAHDSLDGIESSTFQQSVGLAKATNESVQKILVVPPISRSKQCLKAAQ